MKKKQILTYLSFFIITGSFVNLFGQNYGGNNHSRTEDLNPIGNELTWVKILDLAIENGEKTLAKSCLVNCSDLRLVSYRIIGKIKNEQDVESVKSALVNKPSVFPYYNVDRSEILLLTIDEISSRKKYEGISYSLERLKEFLDENIEIGLDKVELTWEHNSKIYKTLCLGSEEKSFVYDNILSNVICLEDPVEAINTINVDNNGETRSSSIGYLQGETWSISQACD